MFWINIDHKKPDPDKFILVRYKDSALDINECPYEVWYGQDVQELVDRNLVAFWSEINHPIAIKNIHLTSTQLQDHLSNQGIDVKKEEPAK